LLDGDGPRDEEALLLAAETRGAGVQAVLSPVPTGPHCASSLHHFVELLAIGDALDLQAE